MTLEAGDDSTLLPASNVVNMTTSDVLTCWLPIPTEQGEFECTPMVQPPFQDWTQVRLFFGNGNLALRVITALFNVEGCPQTISDLIASEERAAAETLGGRSDTTMSFTEPIG